MVDNEDEDDDDVPVPARRKKSHGRTLKNGLSPDEERELQLALYGFRATWRVVSWLFKVIASGVIAAFSGLAANDIWHRLGGP